MKKLLIITFLFLMTRYGYSQFIDKYGFNLGVSNSAQLIQYKFNDLGNQRMDYRTGFQMFLSAEKKINWLISCRSELGYIQKGFKYNRYAIYSDPTAPPEASDKNAIFHDAGLNIGLKFTPVIAKYSPYALVGIRDDYTLSYKDVKFEKYDTGFKELFDKYNRNNLGLLLSLGIEFNNKFYMEVEYNPSLTYSYKSSLSDVKDNCWGLKIGFNINKPDTK